MEGWTIAIAERSPDLRFLGRSRIYKHINHAFAVNRGLFGTCVANSMFLTTMVCPLPANGRRRCIVAWSRPGKKLGGSADLLEPCPASPKGMHRHTFQRLQARAEAAVFGRQN
jgi:hypothetical protein